MKKPIGIIVLLFLTIAVKAQKTTLFKFKYQPNHTYKSSMKMDMDMEMTMQRDSAATARLKASGMKQTRAMKMNMAIGANIKTGAETPTKTFSFTMTQEIPVSKITVNGVEMPPMPPQTTLLRMQSMNGECDAEGKLHVNSITGSSMDEKAKAAITDMMDKMQGQVKFPEKPMAIGETFTQEMPMSIPGTGLNMDFAVKTTYKLTDIKDNMAYFDTTLSMSFDMNSQKDGIQMVGKGNGSGAGKLIYSIPDNYPTTMNNDLTMNFDMSGPKDMKMGIKAIMHSGVSNVISSN